MNNAGGTMGNIKKKQTYEETKKMLIVKFGKHAVESVIKNMKQVEIQQLNIS